MAWVNDSNYYRQLTNDVLFGENFELDRLFEYASSFGHVGLRKTYQNDITTHAEMQIIEDTRLGENINHEFLPFFHQVIKDTTARESKLLEISYTEKIYPREINTFTKKAREREIFDFFGWKSSTADRTIILSGNVQYGTEENLVNTVGATAFPSTILNDTSDYNKSFFGSFDAVDVSGTDPSGTSIAHNITASSWVLDSRSDLSRYPTNITSSYFNQSSSFLATRDQGTRGEGILQNDFSTFALGYNGLYGTPPFSMVYNRRIPQAVGNDVYLSGEAKWEAASGNLGPFYDSYKEYAFNDIRLMAQDHSVIPEFRISEFVEEVLKKERTYPDGKEISDQLSYWGDYLSLTGAIYANSSGDVEIGSQFYKSYSNSDFMKYFEVIDEKATSNDYPISHSRITLKCKAAMKFLPYRGFYPAERATQISELFHKNYLSDADLESATIRLDAPVSEIEARKYLKLRAAASRYQASKALFGPGVLMNSIKAGIAVDYPIFSGDFSSAGAFTGSALGPNFEPLSGSWPSGNSALLPNNSIFTGSMVNHTLDLGIPRLSGSVEHRVSFEDIMNPTNIFAKNMYDNEPHPSASLLYGSALWNKVIEKPAKFGSFVSAPLLQELGAKFTNTKESFGRQISPYTLAMQNFAAETVNFFIEDGHLTTAMSKPIDEYFEKDIEYKMRVKLTNINNVMYDRHSAFGPPVDDSGPGLNLVSLSANTPGAPDSLSLEFADPDNYAGAFSFPMSLSSFPYFEINEIDGIVTDTLNPSPALRLHFYSSTARGIAEPDSGYNFYFDIDNINSGAALGEEVYARLRDSDLVSQYLIFNLSGAVLNISASYNGPSTNGTKTAEADFNTSGFTVFATSSLATNAIFSYDGTGIVPSFSGGVTEPEAYYGTATIATTSSHGHLPYVPPFLDPDSDPYVEVSFSPVESRKYTAQEIIETSSFSYYNFKEEPNNKDANTNFIHAMSLSASLNLGMITRLKTDNIETIITSEGFISEKENPEIIETTTDIKVDENKPLERWVIQTKWETPVLDFSEAKVSALNLDTNEVQFVSGSPWKTRYWDQYYTIGSPRHGVTSGSFMTGSTGMWHQKGSLVGEPGTTRNKGYFLGIEDVVDPSSNTKGLASKLGFIDYTENNQITKALKKAKNYRSRIGVVEDRKLIKEAVVAIPYIVRENLNNRIDFVTFNEKSYDAAFANYLAIKKEFKNVPLSNKVSSIEEYRDFLRRYQKKSSHRAS